jgi:hypothetical protein
VNYQMRISDAFGARNSVQPVKGFLKTIDNLNNSQVCYCSSSKLFVCQAYLGGK